MIIFGGYCKQMLTDHIFIVDIGTQQAPLSIEVTPISSLEKVHKTYRAGHAGVVLEHNSCLYLFGGWNDEQYINHGLLFNSKSLKLVVEQNKDRKLPPPRRDHTLVKMGPYLLLFGGWSHEYNDNDLWLLGSNWEWIKLDVGGIAPCARRGHSACVIGSYMYIFGGLYGFTKYLNDLFIFDGENNEWKSPDLIGSTRPRPRAWHTASVIGNSQILVFGGTAGRLDFFNDVWIFDTKAAFWFQVDTIGEIPRSRASHTLVQTYYDKPYFGKNKKNGDKNDDSNLDDDNDDTSSNDSDNPGNNEDNEDEKVENKEKKKKKNATTNNNENSNENKEKQTRLRLVMFGGLIPLELTADEMNEFEKERQNNRNKRQNRKKNRTKKAKSKKTNTDETTKDDKNDDDDNDINNKNDETKDNSNNENSENNKNDNINKNETKNDNGNGNNNNDNNNGNKNDNDEKNNTENKNNVETKNNESKDDNDNAEIDKKSFNGR